MHRLIPVLLVALACAPDSPRPPQPSVVPDGDVREIVEDFGKRLQNVALLAPAENVKTAIEREYGPFVTPALLQSWLADPQRAPGRMTSSPWPDRIEIGEVRSDATRAVVWGDIVEATSTDRDAARIPITIELSPTAEGWRISRWTRAAADTENPAAVIEAYYAAIDARDYERAYQLWADGGRASGQSFAEFRAGYENTTDVSVETGAPGRIEGAAGSRYVRVPVEITATTSDGQTQRFSGSYTLRRSVVPGATPDQQKWQIHSADVKRIGGATLRPVDEASEDASFATYRRRLLDAVRKRDESALFAMTDADVRTSFGDGDGRKDLLERWDELEWVLTHGGTFRGEGEERMFWAPYVYSAWPESRDSFLYLAVVDEDVPLRAAPRANSSVVAKLSYDIVKKVSERDGWIEIETEGGVRGWVPARSVRSPIDYRAGFHRRGDDWKLAAFVAGD